MPFTTLDLSKQSGTSLPSSIADVIVFVNFVKQDTTNLSLTTSTRITLGGTLVSSDIVEIHYLGKAVNTQTPATGTVTNDMLAGSIANSKLANSSITLNGSAVSLGGSATVGGDNTPAFSVLKDGDQSVSDNTWTKVALNDEKYDTDNAFDSSTNYRFTVPSGKAGKYHFSGYIGFQSNGTDEISYMAGQLRKNGSEVKDIGQSFIYNATVGFSRSAQLSFSATTSLAVGDYVELYGRIDDTNNSGMAISQSYLSCHRLIGV